jgi:serine protease Do
MNKFLTLLTLAASWTWASAAQSLEYEYRTSGPAVREAFEEARSPLQQSSAVIQKGRQVMIFGTVVSPRGHILTKASELGDLSELNVMIDRERYDDLVLLAEDPAWDVALIKVEAEGLRPVNLGFTDDVERGTWLIANGATTRSTRRAQVGVVAANTRPVSPGGGTVLGVSLKAEADGLIVEEVVEDTGAERAGLQPGDQLLSIDGEVLDSREKVAELLGDREVGEMVELKLLREGEEVTLSIELSGRADVFGETQTRNDQMSGEVSERRTGFPRVMQHDIQANRHFVGGPVFDLEGHCVGMNIARFSRCETYAIPARELGEIVARLMSVSDPS